MNNFRLAGFGKRFAAFVIDFFIIIILCGIIISLLIPLGFFSFLKLENSDGDLSPSETMAMAMAGIGILGIILFSTVAPFIYETIMLASAKQATIGKIIMRIKVVKENGEKLSIGDSIIRALIKFISFNFCFLLGLVCLFNKEEQNLHDLAARTFVIEE